MSTPLTPALIHTFLPPRPADGHKGTFGKVNLLSGSVGFTGAPRLCSMAAVRGGCGLVFLGIPALGADPYLAYQVIAGGCMEAMPYPVTCAADFWGKTKPDAVLIGCGLGQAPEVEELVLDCVKRCEAIPLVLDADGINILSRHIDLLKERTAPTILTPHDGEFRRLAGHWPLEDRAADALDLAQRLHCIVVLKGHRTLIAAPDGTCYQNTTGNDGMAKGGSGDVLAGLTVSLLAQGMKPVEAAAAAVWIHGAAGDLAAARFSHHGMTPSDLLDTLREVWLGLE